MHTIKGMCRIPSFSNNDYGITAKFGEISNAARTYSKDQELYRSSTDIDTQLVVFSSKDTNGVDADLPPGASSNIISIQQYLYDRCMGGTMPADTSTLMVDMTAAFAYIGDLEVGVIESDGGRELPTYISYQDTSLSSENYIKIWFSNGSFLSQYDESEIEVVGPIDDYDQFHTLNASELQVLLAEQTKSTLVADLTAITSENPASVLRADSFTWIDITDESQVETVWGVVIYGRAGNNIDTIRRSLINHILDNSTYTREQWVEILPDLFRSNEFIISPRWDLYAIPSETQMSGIYSPLTHIKSIQDRMVPFYPDYPVQHIIDLSYVATTALSGLSMFVVGGPENKDLEYDFLAKFPDYTPASPSDEEFMYMSTGTRSFARKLLDLLTVAETATNFSQIPTDTYSTINRIIRGGIVYVSTSHEGVEYMVVTKMSYTELTGGN